MALILRYSNTEKGGISFIGNTLGLSKKSNLNNGGYDGSIGAFSSLDTTLQAPVFPEGTTLDYLKNGSSAILSLPENSSILYAELIWGGLYKSLTKNISNLIDNPIILKTPLQEFSITPDEKTKENLETVVENTPLGFYIRSANVTDILSNTSPLNGIFSVKAVPALVEKLNKETIDTNHAGWTLAIIYKNNNKSLKNLSLWTGGAIISPYLTSTDINVTGFLTPSSLPIKGKVFVSAAEGDCYLKGDQILFGPDASNLSNLSGPNNPEQNFFASQINDENGYLDTTGTFGTRNANAIQGTAVFAGRQGWDITAVDLSNKLGINQKTAIIRFLTTKDLYVPNSLALEIDSMGANIELNKKVNKKIAKLNEEIEYEITILNSGDLISKTNTLVEKLPPNVSLLPRSITIDGITTDKTFPLSLGELSPMQSKVVKFKVKANSLPTTIYLENFATVDYSYEPFQGQIIDKSISSNIVKTLIYQSDVSIIKAVDKITAEENDILTYTTTFTNNNPYDLFNIRFFDNIPQGTKFIEQSVSIDDVAYPSYNPETGFTIEKLSKNKSIHIKFQVLII